MTKREVIEDFIHQFNAFGDDVRKCFSYGMCYHFSHILGFRFRDEDTHCLYDPVNNHFATQINGRIYDITGDITEETIYSWVLWKTIYYQDPKLAARVMRDCMWKVPDGVILCEFCAHSFDDDWGNKICDIDNHPVTGNDTCGKAVKK